MIRIGAHVLLVLTLIALPATGCSIKKMAVNKIGDVLAASGGTFTTDEDPELIEAAVPFSLKLMESLLDVSPKHRGLLTSVTSGFTQYAYGFVQQEGDEAEDRDLDAATTHWVRARKLYLRARDYGLRGLEIGREGFTDRLHASPAAAVAETDVEDVTLLYWTAAAWAAAIAVSKDDPGLVADLPMAEALIDRALELDESYDHGVIHVFLVSYEMSRSGRAGQPADRAREHFDRAVELSGGQRASPMVALAEAVAVPEQNRQEFGALLERALAIDPAVRPEWRLANLIYQRRARWLLERVDRLILE